MNAKSDQFWQYSELGCGYSIARFMRSAPSELDIADHSDAPLDDVEYICTAAGLLHAMFVDLQSLPECNPTIGRAWSADGFEASLLLALEEIVERLFHVRDLWVAAPLIHRATVLIVWLSADIKALTSITDGDVPPVELSQEKFH